MLEKVVQMVREDKTIIKQQVLMKSDFQELTRDKPDSKQLDYVNKRKHFNHTGKPKGVTPPRPQQQNPKKFGRCRKVPAHGKNNALPERHAMDVVRKVISRFMCHNDKTIRTVESTKDDESFMSMIQGSEGSTPWSITLLVNEKSVEFKIDTTADVTVIPLSEFQSNPDRTLKPPTNFLNGAGSKTLPVKGQLLATLKYREKEIAEEVHAVRRLNHPRLGRPAIEALRLVRRVNEVQTKTDIVKQFQNLFKSLGELEEE